MSAQTHGVSDGQRELNKRLEEIGWALFLIMIGGLWLLPAAQVPEGAWLIGAGLIMLGVNGVRYVNGIKVNNFTVVLGVLALGGGVGSAFVVSVPLFPLLLILIGASIILKPLIGTRG
jgi:hypothetical protein